MKWNNKITDLLNIKYPIIQAPMFGSSTAEMVAAASNSDCLGSLALADLNAENCTEAIRATKKLTNKPFATNIFVHHTPEPTDELKAKYAKTKAFVEQLAQQNKLEVNFPNIDDLKLINYQEQLETIIAENCKILSFTFGNLNDKSIELLKSNGVLLIGTCTSVNEAVILEKSGIDLICVQGIEAGGHRGSFATENIPEIGGLSLLAQVSEIVSTPLIYAGGIYNAKTLLAAKTLGASGFQIGSLLLGSAESALKDFEKERLRKVQETDIVLTKSFSGRYARGIANTFVDILEQTDLILPYPYQNKLIYPLRRAAKINKNLDFLSIWSGQSISEFSGKSTAEILKKLITEVENYKNELS